MKLLAKDLPPRGKEVSVLAIAETLLASGFAIYSTFWLGWGEYLAVYACLAPLLLLRTPQSTRSGLNILCSVGRLVNLRRDRADGGAPEARGNNEAQSRKPKARSKAAEWGSSFLVKFVLTPLVFIFVLALALQASILTIPILIILWAFLVKLCATLLWLLKKPLLSIRYIPINWYKVAFRTDLTTIPEIVPGVEDFNGDYEAEEGILRFTRVSGLFRSFGLDGMDVRKPLTMIRLFIVGMIVFVPVLLFAFLYRMAVKSIAPIYLPLLAFYQIYFPSGESLKLRLRFITGTGLAWAILVWAFLALILNGVVPFIFYTWYNGVANGLVTLRAESEPFVKYLFVRDAELKMWHVASLVSGCITFGVFFWAGQIKAKLAEGLFRDPQKQRATLRKIQTLLITRGALSVYTIICGVVALAKMQNWVKFHPVWLP